MPLTETELKARFKIDIVGFNKYPDKPGIYNVRVHVFDTGHPIDPPDQVVINRDFDFDGDLDGLKNKIIKKLNNYVDEDLEAALLDCKSVTDQYTGS